MIGLYVLLAASIFFCLYFIKWNYKNTFKAIGKRVQGLKNLNKFENALEEKIFKTENLHKRKSRIRYITGSKETKLETAKNMIVKVVTNKYHSWGFLHYCIVTLLGMFAGYWVGTTINNFGVSLVLALVGGVLPYFYLVYRIKRIEKDKNEKILIVMSNIMTSYMPKDSFVVAVKEVIDRIPKPLYEAFKLFIDEITHFGEDNLAEAMNRLEAQLNNYYFYEFMQMAFQTEKGSSGLKYTMKSIPIDYQKHLKKNKEYEVIVEEYNVNFALRILLFPLVIGFLKVTSNDYYEILTTNPLAKAVLFIVVLGFIVASVIYRKYNKEIKFEL